LLRWTCKSTETIAAEFRGQGYSISADTVERRFLDYSLQANAKTKEGHAPPPLYPEATTLLICADGSGSNGSRNWAWKYFLQQFADKLRT